MEIISPRFSFELDFSSAGKQPFRMADSDHIERRREELRSGKRSWHVAELPERDPHVFYLEHVLPLRQLENQAVIEKLVEYRNGQFFDRIEILGGVKA